MTSPHTSRRRQYCARCGQVMFEFYQSPDGHFGMAEDTSKFCDGARSEIRCPTCKARYRLLDRLDPTGAPVQKLR